MTINNHVSRRKALRYLGAALCAVPLAKLIGCSSNEFGTGEGTGDAGALGTGETGADALVADAAAGGSWATGGTAVMTGNYADPFTAGLGSTCDLTCSATLGPCYAETVERQDISEGHDGLPVRLAFLVVDANCKPVEGATVDIWHAAPEGVYSGNDSVAMCTLNDAEALAARWFRGVQTTDAKGRVDFDTCFPGWYRGRTVHIHFTVRVGGTEYVTSQLFFDDTLVDGIVAGEPLYNDRGARDTTNANDGVISAAEAPKYSFQTAKMDDGAMLAWKTLVVRASTSDALCAIQGGSMGPGGPGGPP